MSDSNVKFSEAEALHFHSRGRPGKIEIIASKPMATQRDLSLAYSPGVAVPVRAIAEDPATAYDYTAKGNLVAVISNGTAILGLGNLGALASKPVMEGKAVLFKRFADVDAIDIELDTEDAQRFIDAVSLMEPSFGGINLEDIAAPDCFVIEQTLRERMGIPVFHDDQHGTAIITAAGLINACLLTGRNLNDIRVVVNGAGAAAIACTELIKAMGVRGDHVIMCDRTGVIHTGRDDLDQWKSAHAVETDRRTLKEALVGADVFLGLSAAGALKPDMVLEMTPRPIIFAMANPDPEITPPEAKAARPDAIIATGRSDYPNQVNNVLGFPFIFRGALDVRARAINDEMKIAAAQALAELAREPVPDEVAAAYGGKSQRFGADYIIPAPFDPRLMEIVPAAVAEAAMRSGVAQRPIENMAAYRQQLRSRLNPTVSVLSLAYEAAKANPKRVLFAEGEEKNVLRAAIAFKEGGLGTPVLVGRDEVYDNLKELGVEDPSGYEVLNSRNSPLVGRAVDHLYQRLQRKGYLRREIERMVNQDRNYFAAAMLELGEADAMITGTTRPFSQSLKQVQTVLDDDGHAPFGINIIVGQNQTVLIADTAVTERPTAEELASIAERSAAFARRMGQEPRVAFVSYTTFGNPPGAYVGSLREAVALLDTRTVGFEYEGEMSPEVALNHDMQRRFYPFSRLSGPANILIMPGLQSASLSAKLLRALGGENVLGPFLVGMKLPVQIAPMTASATDLVTLAVLASGGVEAARGR
ncbi:NADP-dependent malic enzyme [Sphingomonas sp. KRR8]|uniref:NADP-dependent malic enzyme n=1 Tax=Sphingomonas sp. KRR8 TaxID=2942996 RepID=UPI00201FC496|nr:phosphate acyltransferase [Sphingomonas sp. KRR8]URD60068.1 NADP-dependent malic enzyme [Sphingomonas sp. KRR8]